MTDNLSDVFVEEYRCKLRSVERAASCRAFRSDRANIECLDVFVKKFPESDARGDLVVAPYPPHVAQKLGVRVAETVEAFLDTVGERVCSERAEAFDRAAEQGPLHVRPQNAGL